MILKRNFGSLCKNVGDSLRQLETWSLIAMIRLRAYEKLRAFFNSSGITPLQTTAINTLKKSP